MLLPAVRDLRELIPSIQEWARGDAASQVCFLVFENGILSSATSLPEPVIGWFRLPVHLWRFADILVGNNTHSHLQLSSTARLFFRTMIWMMDAPGGAAFAGHLSHLLRDHGGLQMMICDDCYAQLVLGRDAFYLGDCSNDE